MSAVVRHRVWDVPTRVVHWALAVGVAFQWISGEYDLVPMQWHYVVGYALFVLVLFRIVWGFVGSESARFSSFVRGYGAVVRYARAVAEGPVAQAGHNPLGAWSVLALLASLLIQAVSGLWTSDDILEQGPLVAGASEPVVAWMSTIHRTNERVLLVLIVLHLGAVAWHAFARREDLVRAMVDGSKTLEHDPGLRFVPAWRAMVVFAACAAVVYAIVR